MMYEFIPMTLSLAKNICTWQYPMPYTIYSMDGSSECINELLEGNYFVTMDASGNAAGFVCAGEMARVPGGYHYGIYNEDQYIDIGLGMRPDLTGRGNGYDFVCCAIHFLQNSYDHLNFRLVVLTFNERAIQVYERAGFTKGMTFYSKIGNIDFEFLEMKRDRKS